MSKAKILIVEDEADIRELIHFHLFKEKYEVILAEDGERALNLIELEKPDLVLLDIMLPIIDGIEVCKRMRANKSSKDIPVIMITAKGTEEDIVSGLELGADDYITKPFSPKVLLARVKTQLRKSSKVTKTEEQLSLHGLSIDPKMRKVSSGDSDDISLTYSQFQILHLLAKKPGWVFSRPKIVDMVRGENHAITDRSVDVQIVLLRKKLGEYGNLIETVRGAGYRFKEIN